MDLQGFFAFATLRYGREEFQSIFQLGDSGFGLEVSRPNLAWGGLWFCLRKTPPVISIRDGVLRLSVKCAFGIYIFLLG